jgi:hypothetical protein
MSTGEVFQELYLDPVKSSLPAGARIGGLVIMPGLAPVDPQTGAIVGDDMESQLRAVLQNMDRVLAAAQTNRGQRLSTRGIANIGRTSAGSLSYSSGDRWRRPDRFLIPNEADMPNTVIARRTFLYFAAGAVGLPAGARFAQAQHYPARPVGVQAV